MNEEMFTDAPKCTFFVAFCVETLTKLSCSNVNQITTISPTASNASSSCMDSALGLSPTSSNPSSPSSQTTYLFPKQTTHPKNVLNIQYKIVGVTNYGNEKTIIGGDNFINLYDDENLMEKLDLVNILF